MTELLISLIKIKDRYLLVTHAASATTRPGRNARTAAFAKFARSMYPAVARLVSPMLALIGVAITKQIRANFATEFGVENVLHPLDHRLIR